VCFFQDFESLLLVIEHFDEISSVEVIALNVFEFFDDLPTLIHSYLHGEKHISEVVEFFKIALRI
jgi:hypothetical protein